MKCTVALICVLPCLFRSALSHQSLRSDFPNGLSVPNPCGTPSVWGAVGHYNPDRHTFYKNPFARDFYLNGYKWTSTVCQMDSDNDGKTNGEELGDPNCVWTVGGNPQFSASGHPGICEPVGDSRCSYQNFACDCLEYCPNLENSMPH